MSKRSDIVMSSTFDTYALPTKERYGAFRDSISVVFEIDRPSSQMHEFSAQIKTWHLGDLLLVRCHAPGQIFCRSAKAIARDDLDHYLVQVFLSGRTRGEHQGRSSIGGDGNLIVIDMAQNWRALNDDFDNLTLVVPRRLLAPKLRSENGHHGRTLDVSSPMSRIVSDFIVSLFRNADQMSSVATQSIADAGVGLLAAAMNGTEYSGECAGADHFSVRFRAKKYIEDHLGNSNLSLDSIQDALKVSRTHLYRAFMSEGGVATYIRERRLRHAVRLLGSSSQRSIKELAFTLGFKSETSFGRTFRQKFGLSPLDAKTQAVDLLSMLKNEDASDDKMRIWEDWVRSL